MIQRAKDCVFLVAQMRSPIAQQSKRRGSGRLCTTKERSSDHRRRYHRLRKINRPGQFVSAQKSEEKHCFCLVLHLNEREQPATKGGEIN